jgi:hypothetical protein
MVPKSSPWARHLSLRNDDSEVTQSRLGPGLPPVYLFQGLVHRGRLAASGMPIRHYLSVLTNWMHWPWFLETEGLSAIVTLLCALCGGEQKGTVKAVVCADPNNLPGIVDAVCHN